MALIFAEDLEMARSMSVQRWIQMISIS